MAQRGRGCWEPLQGKHRCNLTVRMLHLPSILKAYQRSYIEILRMDRKLGCRPSIPSVRPVGVQSVGMDKRFPRILHAYSTHTPASILMQLIDVYVRTFTIFCSLEIGVNY